MDCTFTPAEDLFRDEVRTWLEEHVPKQPRPSDLKAAREFDLAWQRTQFEGGWAGISWPSEYGGRGLSLVRLISDTWGVHPVADDHGAGKEVWFELRRQSDRRSRALTDD